MNIVNNILI